MPSNLKTLLPLEGFCYQRYVFFLFFFFKRGFSSVKLLLKCWEYISRWNVLTWRQKKRGRSDWWPKEAEPLEKRWHHPKAVSGNPPLGAPWITQLSGGSDNKPPLSSFRLDGRHVVFGSVKEGLDVVKKVESFGSRSGRTSKKITITDCGELE